MQNKTTHRFLLEIEQAIIRANRECITQRLGALSRQRFIDLAKAVAHLRAEYLHAAFHANWEDESLVKEMAAKREAFQEAVAAYDALERAIERDYVQFSS